MQPESSDGFASVGTILPEEGAALLPGGSFRFLGDCKGSILQDEWKPVEVLGLPPLAQKLKEAGSSTSLRFAQDDSAKDGPPGLFLPL
jgi:hypothetical protein